MKTIKRHPLWAGLALLALLFEIVGRIFDVKDIVTAGFPSWGFEIISLVLFIAFIGVVFYAFNKRLEEIAERQSGELTNVIIKTDDVTDKQKPPLAQDVDLTSPHLQGYSIKISQLVLGDYVVRNKTFENCWLFGPAVIGLSGTFMHNCTFRDKLEHLFWEVEPKRFYTGGILFKDCVFRNCNFVHVGLAGTPEQIESYKKGISPVNI